MGRAVPVLLLMSLLGSAEASPIVLRPGDPALDGKDYLISEQDFRAVIDVTRKRLAKVAPWFGVRRIHVEGANDLIAYVGQPDQYGELAYITLHRVRGAWQINSEAFERIIID